MNIFVKLGQDIVRLWNEYAGLYLSGVWNTISLAVLCTAVGCLIVAVLHIWKRNTLLSIGVGTVSYMLLVQMVF